MTRALLLSIGLFISLLVAASAVTSLPFPFVYTPIITITGLLVLNRVGIAEGAVWLIAGGFFLTAAGSNPHALLENAIVAGLGALLTTRVFATRSAYALLGLGVATGVSAGAAVLIVGGMRNLTLGLPLIAEDAAARAAWTLILLLAGLYAGFASVVMLRQRLQKFFVVR